MTVNEQVPSTFSLTTVGELYSLFSKSGVMLHQTSFLATPWPSQTRRREGVGSPEARFQSAILGSLAKFSTDYKNLPCSPRIRGEMAKSAPLEEMPIMSQARLILNELGEYFSSMCRMGHLLHSFPNRSLLDSDEFSELLTSRNFNSEHP